VVDAAELMPEHVRSKAMINPPIPSPPRGAAADHRKTEPSISTG
jgi:hypothetical protein